MKTPVMFLIAAACLCPALPLNAQTETPSLPEASLFSLGRLQAEKTKAQGEEIRIPVNWQASAEDRRKAHAAWETICRTLKDNPPENRTLLVAYVTFTDKPAIENYGERYDRVLKNIQGFFADQMKANGFPPLTFPLELDENGKLVIHEAHTGTPLKGQPREKVQQQAVEAAENVLKTKNIDIRNKYLLIIVPENGIPSFMRALPLSEFGYPFDSQNGICFIEDRKGVDPRQLSSKAPYDQKRKNTKYYPQTIGENAAFIMQALAHELGHLFTVLHTMENFAYASAGKSLMGYGNQSYSHGLSTEGSGSFLEPSNALILASHPLFTGKQTENELAEYSMINPQFSPIQGGSLFSSTVKLKSRYPGYAVTVHLDPPENDDYDSTASSSLIGENGLVQLRVTRPGYTGYARFKLLFHLTNNQKILFFCNAWLTKEGLHVPELQENLQIGRTLNAWKQRNMAEAASNFAQEIKKIPPFTDREKYTRFWEKAMTYDQPQWNKTASRVPPEQKQVSLVDCRPSSVMSEFCIPCWDTLYPSELGAVPYMHYGVPDRFIFVHANGRLNYDLGSKWKRFQFTGSVPLNRNGSVQYEVRGDGRILFTSKILKEGESVKADIPVKKVKALHIHIKDGGDGNTSDWAVLGNPVLRR